MNATSECLCALAARHDVSSNRAESLWHALATRYAEPHRAYHTMEHVNIMLTQLAKLGGPEHLAWPIWFHDVIYDPKSSNNEAESAALFSRLMGDVLPPEVMADGERLILATDPRTSRGQEKDEQWITDLDLAILGSPAPVYAVYTRAVKKEYATVPDEAFAAGRVEVMGRFLLQSKIYLTEEHEHLEAQARLNIQSEIDELRKQIH